jgi:hypothetical protein
MAGFVDRARRRRIEIGDVPAGELIRHECQVFATTVPLRDAAGSATKGRVLDSIRLMLCATRGGELNGRRRRVVRIEP